MSTQFPVNLDSFSNPGATDTEDAAGLEHDIQHSNLNDAVAAIQAKLGKNSDSNAASVDFFMKNLFTHGSGPPGFTPALPFAFYQDDNDKSLYYFVNGQWNP